MDMREFEPRKGSISKMTWNRSVLTVTFSANERRYQYFPVKEEEFDEMIDADSHGVYLNQVIRKIPGIQTKEV